MSSIFFTESEAENVNNTGGDFIFKVEGPENPIIFKIVKNPHSGGKAYEQFEYFTHMEGPDQKDTRSHVSLASVSDQKSPEKERFFELCEQLKAMRESGLEGSKEYDIIFNKRKKFYTKERSYILIVEPNSPKIKALHIGKAAHNAIFGKPATKNRPAVVGVSEGMRKKGLSPMLLADQEKNKKGWLKLYKTGEGLSTEYHVEVVSTREKRVIDGEEVDVTKITELDVHKDITTLLTGEKELNLKEIPNPREFEKSRAWTYEESVKFVQEEGSITGVPARILNKKKFSDTPANTEFKEASTPSLVSEDVNALSMDDIPF